jgi:hypothetical protein
MLALLSLFFLGALIYWKALSLNFLADDYIWLLEARETAASELGNYYLIADGFFYRPTTKIYFWMLYRFVGLNAGFFHALNLLWHILNAGLVYLLARRIFEGSLEKARNIKAWFVAAVFLVHPVHVEPAVWVSAVTELLPATGILLSMLVVEKRGSRNKIIKFGNTLILGFLYFVAVGGHEYAVLLPIILFLWQVYQNKRESLRAACKSVLSEEKVLYLVLGIVGLIYLGLRYIANSHWQGGDYSYDLTVLPINMVANALAYVFLSLIGPETYNQYLWLRAYTRANFWVVAIMALIGVVLCVWFRRMIFVYFRNKKLMCGLGIYLILLMAFLPLGSIAERYVYVASIWVYVMLVILAEFIWKSESKFGVGLVTIFLTINIALLSYLLGGNVIGGGWFWFLIWGLLLVVNAGVIYKILMGMKVRRQVFLSMVIGLACWGMMSYVYIMRDWHAASAEVNAFLGYFSYACDEYAYGDSVTINLNTKLRTAWVFPVGHEQAVELVCNKKISIIRI